MGFVRRRCAHPRGSEALFEFPGAFKDVHLVPNAFPQNGLEDSRAPFDEDGLGAKSSLEFLPPVVAECRVVERLGMEAQCCP